MTPRQQDVAYVLEDISGVVDVYALAKPRCDFDFAVRLQQGKGSLAAAHYAVLRVLDYEACGRVLFCETELPPGLAGAATRLSLSTAEREESRARVAERPRDMPPPRKRVQPGSQHAALLVGCSKAIVRAVVAGLGADARVVVASDAGVGAEHALGEELDLILCARDLAFGPEGLLDRVGAVDPFVAARVILVGAPEEQAPARARLQFRNRANGWLSTPIDPETALEVATTGFVVVPWSIPLLPTKGSPPPPTDTKSAELRVVVVDEDDGGDLVSGSSDGLRVDVASDVWSALDALAAWPRPALVFCSASMRVGERPIYRALWAAHPEIKWRFVLIASPHVAGDVDVPSRRHLVERPVTRERLVTALRERGLM